MTDTTTESGCVGFGVAAPPWLLSWSAELEGAELDEDGRMDSAIALSEATVREGSGGPFGAVVFDIPTGRIIAAGANLVPHSDLSIAHAEVVALSLAQTRLGTWDLGSVGSFGLATSAQPCIMCAGAVLWSGIRTLEYAAASADVERITGFDEGPLPADWESSFRARGIAVTSGRRASQAHDVLHEFRRRVDDGTLSMYSANR